MHAVSHSLAQRAPPATRARARWQPYSAIQTLSARSSPANYLNTPASSTSSNSPTPLLNTLCEHDRPRHAVMPLREPAQVQKSKFVVGLVDQAVKSLCDIWRPEDIPQTFITGCSRSVSDLPPSDFQAPSIATRPAPVSRNSQLPSPITPSIQPSPISYSFPTTNAEQHSPQPQQLVPLKGFVHEVLRRSRTSGSVLQTALCYLEAIRSKVPELVEKEKNGTGVQGEIDLTYRVVQGDLEAEEWRELALDSVMANFIHLDAAVDLDVRDQDTVPATKVPEHDEIVLPISTPAPTLSATTSLSGLKSHIAQVNLAKKHKTPSGPLAPMPPLPSPLLCPRRTFLASLILASKFTQDRCYSNKAWAKLSGLPPREIGRCERALGDALDWRLWVGKAPTNTRPVARSQSDGDLFAESTASSKASMAAPSLTSSGLRRSATVSACGFRPDAFRQGSFAHMPSVQEDPWELLAWPSSSSFSTQSIATPPLSNGSSNSSPSTPALSHSPSSTDSSSGDRTIQMTSFVDAMPSPAQSMPSKSFGSDAYLPHHHVVYDVDPTSGLAFPMYSAHGLDYSGPYTNAPGIISEQIYWTE
ncbi:hypothetical protein FIBSPDRAFT_1035709 [Athelia psychrophila]|uniref:Cyclin N-terminal domain-containing protein n=1 Tax=Athelia psychrophila TaxID=1759441 RepID=A0A166XFI9_9AGAM|nr:hypothetical protein FIBSPDRAFT_1035709 [Fibularhizoctonia sp. CBS 109695]